MRKRTKAEIVACPHNAPLEEVCGTFEYGLRGDFSYRVVGCPKCGGAKKTLAMHLNYGKPKRTEAEAERLNAEEQAEYTAKVKAWRMALPEPEGN